MKRTAIRAAVYGHLVGDAIGVPYEGRKASQIGTVELRGYGSHDQPPGTWSDDGALMLALLDSLKQKGFDPEDQGRRYLAWATRGAYTPDRTVFDLGGATRRALARLGLRKTRGAAPWAAPHAERTSFSTSSRSTLPAFCAGPIRVTRRHPGSMRASTRSSSAMAASSAAFIFSGADLGFTAMPSISTVISSGTAPTWGCREAPHRIHACSPTGG